jgi:N-acetylmuramoyl-L-alanine amidase
MAKVILDAGHGGRDTGEVIDDRLEKNENLKMTLAVGNILNDNGVNVVYIRTTDIEIPFDEKMKFVNDTKGDLFVSIHRISNIRRDLNAGVECLVQGQDEFANLVANNINKRLEEIGFVNLGVIQADLDTMRFDAIPSVVLLIGLFRTASNSMQYDIKFNETANAIAQGILESFGINIEKTSSDYRYRVQTGLFRVYDNALNLQIRLLREGYRADIVRQGELYAVHVGDFTSLDEAVVMEQYLRRSGYNTLLVAV